MSDQELEIRVQATGTAEAAKAVEEVAETVSETGEAAVDATKAVEEVADAISETGEAAQDAAKAVEEVADAAEEAGKAGGATVPKQEALNQGLEKTGQKSSLAKYALAGLSDKLAAMPGPLGMVGRVMQSAFLGPLALATTAIGLIGGAIMQWRRRMREAGEEAAAMQTEIAELMNQMDPVRPRDTAGATEDLARVTRDAAAAAREADGAWQAHATRLEAAHTAADDLRRSELDLAVAQGRMTREAADEEMGGMDVAAVERRAQAKVDEANDRLIRAVAERERARRVAEDMQAQVAALEGDETPGKRAVKDAALLSNRAEQAATLLPVESSGTLLQNMVGGEDALWEMLNRLKGVAGFAVELNKIAGNSAASTAAVPAILPALVEQMNADAAKMTERGEELGKEDAKILEEKKGQLAAYQETSEAARKEAQAAQDAATRAMEDQQEARNTVIPKMENRREIARIDAQKAEDAKRAAEMEAQAKAQEAEWLKGEQSEAKGIAGMIQQRLQTADGSRDSMGMIPMLEGILNELQNGTDAAEMTALADGIPQAVRNQSEVMLQVAMALRAVGAEGRAQQAAIAALRKEVEAIRSRAKQ